MGLFDKIKNPFTAKKPDKSSAYYVTLQINARLQPLHRGDIYEDPICEALETCGCGSTCGGGTMMQSNGEVEFCDVEIELHDNSLENMDKLTKIIDETLLPKGSILRTEDFERPVGTLEGLALYLNGTELPDETYQNCDINHVVERVNDLLGESGSMYSHWQGPEDTALYFYGPSFIDMKAKMAKFIAEYPLCEKCRIEQIA